MWNHSQRMWYDSMTTWINIWCGLVGAKSGARLCIYNLLSTIPPRPASVRSFLSLSQWELGRRAAVAGAGLSWNLDLALGGVFNVRAMSSISDAQLSPRKVKSTWAQNERTCNKYEDGWSTYKYVGSIWAYLNKGSTQCEGSLLSEVHTSTWAQHERTCNKYEMRKSPFDRPSPVQQSQVPK